MRTLNIIRFVLALVGFSFLFVRAAQAMEIKSIDETFVSGIRTSFKEGQSPLTVLNEQGSRWNCDLYGMRSRLQTTKKIGFYSFSKRDQKLINSGSQVIREYENSTSGLKGSSGPLAEEIRIDKLGRLIGEISIPLRKDEQKRSPIRSENMPSVATPGRVVVAYSICTAGA